MIAVVIEISNRKEFLLSSSIGMSFVKKKNVEVTNVLENNNSHFMKEKHIFIKF